MIYIEFRDRKLRKRLETYSKCAKKYGKDNAIKIIQRLNEIQFSENLEEFSKIYRSAKCHPLKGKRKGQFAVYVKHPYRIVFKPIASGDVLNKNGFLDMSQVTKIEILEVVDYHV